MPGGVEPEPDALVEPAPLVEPEPLRAAQSRCSSPRPQFDLPDPLVLVALDPLIEDVQPQVDPPDELPLRLPDPLAHPPLALELNFPEPPSFVNATPASLADNGEPGIRSGEQDATVNTSTPAAAAKATATFIRRGLRAR